MQMYIIQKSQVDTLLENVSAEWTWNQKCKDNAMWQIPVGQQWTCLGHHTSLNIFPTAAQHELNVPRTDNFPTVQFSCHHTNNTHTQNYFHQTLISLSTQITGILKLFPTYQNNRLFYTTDDSQWQYRTTKEHLHHMAMTIHQLKYANTNGWNRVTWQAAKLPMALAVSTSATHFCMLTM